VSEIVPDHIHAGTFVVRQGVTEQSWVDLDDPLRVEFEYVRRIVEALEATLLARPEDERVRLVHVGGGGLSIPRYVAARRPGTIQVVLEPDADLVEQVRARLPLAREATVRIRIVDGRAGLGGLRPASVDGVVLDAFVGAQVPGELATRECFEAVGAILADTGLLAMNLGDRAPFDWGRRCLAGLAGQFPHLALSAEIAVWKGRRYGNLVALASRRPLPLDALERDLTRTAFGYRLLSGGPLRSWIGGAEPFTDGDTRDSIDPVAHGWLR
jgi:spermidine synthase